MKPRLHVYRGPDGKLVLPYEISACVDVTKTSDGLILVRLESDDHPDLAFTMILQIAGGIIVAMTKAAA